MGVEQPSRDQPREAAPVDDVLAMERNEFQTAFGEPVEQTLNLDTWLPGEDLAAMYQNLEREVAGAVRQEGRIRERIRSELFPRVFTHPQAPAQAGCYTVDVAMLERIHRG